MKASKLTPSDMANIDAKINSLALKYNTEPVIARIIFLDGFVTAMNKAQSIVETHNAEDKAQSVAV
jgi:hypothetical protein